MANSGNTQSRSIRSTVNNKSNQHTLRRLSYVGAVPLIAFVVLLALFGFLGMNPSTVQAAGDIYFVIDTGTDANACTDSDPCSLAHAVDLAVDGDEIHVASGTYVSVGSAPVLQVSESLTITGGYVYNAGAWSTVPEPGNITTLDGNDDGRVVEIGAGASPIIENFHVQNGRSTEGGGIYIADGDGRAIIRHNTIHDNVASGGVLGGGGIYDGGGSTIAYNKIYDNDASPKGAGIYLHNDSATISSTLTFNEIYGNIATAGGNSFGGGVFLFPNARAHFVGNKIYENRASIGGGLAANGAQLSMYSNLMYLNEATNVGGAIWSDSNSTIWNNTIVNNTATTDGGGLHLETRAMEIHNTIIAFNTSPGNNDGINNDNNSPATVSGTFNNVFDDTVDASGISFSNAVTGDPAFVNATTQNYHLTENSAAHNTGSTNTPTAVNVDIDEQVRPNPDDLKTGIPRHEVGADEYYADFAQFELTPPIVGNTVERGAIETFAHYLNNTGTVSDIYDITCSSDIFTVTYCSPQIQILTGGAPVEITTSVEIPSNLSPYDVGKTMITATSTVSPELSEVALLFLTIAPHPALNFTPNYSRTELPGEIITLTHAITNTGDAFENFIVTEIDDASDSNWGELIPTDPYTIGIPAGGVGYVQVQIAVPEFAPQGLANEMSLQASSEFDPSISDTVVNTITAKATTGTRYVTSGGEDTDNNCTQSNNPCGTIERAVGQAVSGDEIRIGKGDFPESNINVNDTIYISGGWENFNDDGQGDEPDPTFTRIDAQGNSAVFVVGAGSPTISVLTMKNGANFNGGGVFVSANTQPEFSNVVFENNTAGNQGGAIYASGTGTVVTVRKGLFANNSSASSGGSVYMSGGILSLNQSQFMTSTTGSGGGGALIINNNSQLTAQNNLFYNSSTTGNGGSVRLNGGSANFNFNTWVENNAVGNGGGVYNNNATVTIQNSIFATNTAASGGAIYENSDSTTLDYLNLWNNTTNVADEGSNSFSADPLFADEVFHLADGSPSIDRANAVGAPAVDFEDDFRPSDEGHDIGYDERAGCRVQRADVIYGSIQDAVDINDQDNLIKVSGICRGVHQLEVGSVTISQTVHLTKSVVIQGGWDGDFEKQHVDPTQVDPEGQGRAFYITDGVSVTIEAITVTNGSASGLGGGPADEDAGGAFYNVDGDVTLKGVRIFNSNAELGGGFYNNSGTSLLTWEMYEKGDEEIYTLSEIANSSADDGAGVYNNGGEMVLDGVWIHHNQAANDGGGLFNTSPMTVANTILDSNMATRGAGLYNEAADSAYLHMTVYNNTAVSEGGGIYNAAGAPEIASSIFESNQATAGSAIYDAGNAAVDYNYYYLNTVGGNAVTGTHSIETTTVPPGLVDPDMGDFHIADDSPAVDKGDIDSLILADFEDDRRPANQGPDMGVDEIVGCLAQLNDDAIYGSLQAAINAAEVGDVIKVSGICSGVHEYDSGTANACGGVIQTGVHIDKELTIIGGWDEEFSEQEDGEYSVLDAKELGRVMYIGQGISTTVEGFEMINGVADNGAGVCIDDAKPTLHNNRIYSNTATTNGGGLYLIGSSSFTSTIQNNFVFRNEAVDGAGVYNEAGDHGLWHNTFYGNIASGNGGGFYNESDTPDVRGNILMANEANDGSPNSGAAVFADAALTVDFNDYFDNSPFNFGLNVTDGGNSIYADPGFFNVISGVFTITYDSPVVDFDIPDMPVLEDFEGDPRPSHQGFDLGADEVGGCYAAFQHDVNNVFGSVQLAVDLIDEGMTVLVDGICLGTNTRQVDGNSVTQGLVVTKSVVIDGIWDHPEDESTVTTTLDALNDGRVLYVGNGATVTVTNLIMRQGDANGAGNGNNGGGVYNDGVLYLADAWVQENTAVSGGGIYNESMLLVDNTKVLTNTATQDGGGIYNETVDGILTTIQGSEIRNNLMGDNGDGGGLYHQAGRLMLNGNRIHRNGYIGSPGGNGGGIYLNSGTAASVDVRNNFIYYNLANEGGGLYNANTNGRLWHNTFFGNIAIDFLGGGIASVNGSPDIRNNIVDNNDGYGIYTQNGSPVIRYNNAVRNTLDNIFSSSAAVSNNISEPPIYMSMPEDDFHLYQGSPGEDEGDPDVSDYANTHYVDNDIDGHKRPTNSGPDMGADEIDSCLVKVGDEIFTVLQKAIDYAEISGNDTIRIARGECRGTFLNEDTNTRQVAYISEDLRILGSLDRTDFSADDWYNPDVGTISSIINANGEGRVFHIAPNATVSFTHIAIVNGNAVAAEATANDDGGGVYNPSGTAGFNQVFMCNNTAENGAGYYGGATSYTDMTGSTLGTCEPAQVTEFPDGTLLVRYISGLLGNEANNDGGGAYIAGHADLRNNAVWENWSGLSGSGHGAGIFNSGENNRFVNNFYISNVAASPTSDGGALYNTGTQLRVLHNTIRNNYAGDQGGGIFNAAGNFELNSSIIYSNTSVTGDGGLHYTQAPTKITHNNFNDNVPRDESMNYGSIYYTWNPGLRFDNWSFSRYRYHLSVNSPNIDRADPNLLPEVDYDIDINYRPDGNGLLNVPPHGISSDVGADEYIKDFGCEIDPEEETREVAPGNFITYTLRIINVGNPPYTNLDDGLAPHGYTDTIKVTYSQLQGWSELEGGEDEQSFELGWQDNYPNGDWVTRILTVTIPEGAQVGRGETTLVRCESTYRPEMIDIATINTDVGLAAGVEVIPDLVQDVVPGEVITIEQTVRNLQNQAADYLLTPSPGPRHASAVLLDSDTLSRTNAITVSLTPSGTNGFTTTALLEVTILETALAGDIANPGLVATNPDAQNASIHRFTILPTAGTRYVAPSGKDTTNCRSVEQPCATIQHAIDQAVDGDEIRVAAGTYTDYVTKTVGADNFQQNVFIDKSLTIAGGYMASGDDPFTIQGPVTAITSAVTLDGENKRRVMYIADGVTVTLSGIIIENGRASANLSMNGDTGAFGSGIYNAGADITIYSTWIQNNIGQYGAGVYHEDGLLTMYSNILSGNTNPAGSATHGQGGGLYLANGVGLIENNTFADNTVNDSTPPSLFGAIAAAPTGFGGGIFLDEPATATVINNIFSENGATTGTAVYISSTATLTNSYNLYVPEDIGNSNTIANGKYGTGRILTNTAGFESFTDYHIRVDSPAKDVGTNSVSISQTVDIDLEERIMGIQIDIGADERTQRPRFVFEPAVLSATIDTGDVYTYYHWITNTGDFVDSYNLEMFNQVIPAGDTTWDYHLEPTSTGNLNPLESIQVTLVVTGGSPGYMDVTTITATSASDLTASVEDTTTITQTPGVDIEQFDAQIGLPGQLVTYSHTLTNTGNGIDQFDLTTTAVPTDWVITVTPTQTGFLTPSETIPFTVTVLVPADALSSTQHVVTVTAVATDPYASDFLTDTTTVGLLSNLILEPDNARDVPDGTSTIYTHTLTSNSNIVDTITLTATGSLPGWGIDIDPQSVVMNPLETRIISVTVDVPPNTGGLTHLTHVTATSTLPGLIATATNTTKVPTTTGLLFTPNLTETVYAGEMAYYTHTLTNLGNLTDTFNISSNSVEGWIYDVTGGLLEVGPGASVQVTAVISVPLGTPAGTDDILEITATSQTVVTTTATVTDTTRVIQFVALTFTPDHDETGDAGTTKVYTHTLRNDGDGTDTFDLTYSGVPAWTVTLEPSSSIQLGVGETAVITANLTIPNGASGYTNTTTITATSAYSPAISASVVNTTTVSGVPAQLGVLLEPDRFAVGNLGETITYYHTVTNTGDATEDFGLSIASSVWATTVEPAQIELAVGASAPVTVTVTIPLAASAGEEDMAVITAVSQSDPSVSSSVTDTTRVVQTHGLLFFPDNAQTTDPATTVFYTHTLQNTGNAEDTFAITPNSSNGWAVAVDSPVTVASGESTTVYITLTVPAGTDGQVDVMQVTASSIISPVYTAMVTNTTTVNEGIPPVVGVDIEPDYTDYAVGGDVLTYVHVVTNTGEGADTFSVNAVSSQRWIPISSPASLTLASGETGTVIVTVTVPLGVNPGTRDETTVTVTSQSDAAVTDSAVDTTIIPGIFLPIIMKPATVVNPTPTPPPGPTATPGCTGNTGRDLIVENVWVEPSTPTAGVPATVYVTIKNQGTKDLLPSNNFYTDFYVDREPYLKLVGDIEWETQDEWVPAGQSYTLNASYVFSGGTHQLWAQVDTDNFVNECPHEDNNISSPVLITVSGTGNVTHQDAPNQRQRSLPNDAPRHTPTPHTRAGLPETNVQPVITERPLSTPTPTPTATPPPRN